MFKGQLKVTANNKRKLKKFLKIFRVYSKKWKLNLSYQNFFLCFFTRLRKITVLKSPHVHKTAQEHYSLFSYSTKFEFLQLTQPEKFFLFLKGINFILFESKFVLRMQFFEKGSNLVSLNKLGFADLRKNYISRLNPNNFMVINRKSLKSYVQLFDMFGELNLLNFKVIQRKLFK